MRLVVVGVCASGKTTLVNALRALGLDADNVPQEHSCIKALWKKKEPDILILLEASLETIRKRRIVPWGEERLKIQRERLKDARDHADLVIDTNPLSREAVVQQVLEYVRGKGCADYCP